LGISAVLELANPSLGDLRFGPTQSLSSVFDRGQRAHAGTATAFPSGLP
jgi:hypothetical protein